MARLGVRQNLACCGVSEIHGLRRFKTPEAAMEAFAATAKKKQGPLLPSFFNIGPPRHANRRGRAFVLFTGIEQAKYAERFARLIRQARLGRVTSLPYQMNPNSGNMLRAWLWAPEWTAVDAWAAARKEVSRG